MEVAFGSRRKRPTAGALFLWPRNFSRVISSYSCGIWPDMPLVMSMANISQATGAGQSSYSDAEAIGS
jgi:hypothetical protein